MYHQAHFSELLNNIQGQTHQKALESVSFMWKHWRKKKGRTQTDKNQDSSEV